jgi:hypothetical protein
MVKDPVAYVVSPINIERSATINQSMAPKVLFMGMRVDFRKEFGLAFGDYCEVYDGTHNTSRPRRVPCVALYPCNNAAGSWAFMNLKTKQRIRRTQWVKMVTTEVIIAVLNAFDDAEEGRQMEDSVKQVDAVPEKADVAEPEKDAASPSPENAGVAEGLTMGVDDFPELIPQEEDDSDDEAEEEEEADEDEESSDAEVQPEV